LHIMPGYARVNLWPDAGPALDVDRGTLPRLTPLSGINDWFDKRYLALDPTSEFHAAPLPLAAVYLLDERASDVGAPRVEAVPSGEAFIRLTGDSYVSYALDAPMRAQEFDVLGDLVRTVPVRRATAHEDPLRLPDLCAAVLRDLAGISGEREASAARR